MTPPLLLGILLVFAISTQSHAQENFGLISDELVRTPASTASDKQDIYQRGFHKATIIIEADAQNEDDDESMMVFPNPAENEIIIKIYDLYKGMIQVRLDNQGELKHENRFESAEATYRLSLKDLPAGTYWLHIIEEDNNNKVHKYKVRYKP